MSRGYKMMVSAVTSLLLLHTDYHLYPHLFCCACIEAVADFVSREK